MNTEELFSTEIIEENSTELLEENSAEVETVVEVDAAPLVPYLEQIAADVRIILLIVVLTFCQSCMRAWRKNTIRMGD